MTNIVAVGEPDFGILLHGQNVRFELSIALIHHRLGLALEGHRLLGHQGNHGLLQGSTLLVAHLECHFGAQCDH